MTFVNKTAVLLLTMAYGCLEPVSHQALTPVDGSPDTGPWTDCMAALQGDGRTHDPCGFLDGSGCSFQRESYREIAICRDRALLRSSLLTLPSETCVAPGTAVHAVVDEEGCTFVEACIENEDGTGWFPHRSRQICEGPKAARVSALEEPWDFESEGGCFEFFDAHGRSDDPCVGEGVCVHGDGFFVAWCREGTVALANDTPFL
jgi:hypothetical protein